MKFKLVNDNSVNEALRIKRHRLSEEDSQGMQKFHMVYTVDGVKSEQDISAANIAKAEELVRKQYDGKNIIFTSKKPVQENLEEDLEIPEKVLEADEKLPQTEETVGLSNAIIQEINGEWETIQHYNDLISIMRTEGRDDMINVISDIVDEENKHIGQLQKCLQMISPNVFEIDSGETEAIGQLNTIDNEVADDSPIDCADDDFGPNSGFDIYLV